MHCSTMYVSTLVNKIQPFASERELQTFFLVVSRLKRDVFGGRGVYLVLTNQI